jgi:hypothetical protein
MREERLDPLLQHDPDALSSPDADAAQSVRETIRESRDLAEAVSARLEALDDRYQRRVAGRLRVGARDADVEPLGNLPPEFRPEPLVLEACSPDRQTSPPRTRSSGRA